MYAVLGYSLLQLDGHSTQEPTALLGDESGAGSTEGVTAIQQVVDIETKLESVDGVVGTQVHDKVGTDITLGIKMGSGLIAYL